MEKYKLCPGCGHHNNPLAIECDECGEDLSSVRILDEQTEEQANKTEQESSHEKIVKQVRICEECGEKNESQARKCAKCGEDISMILPVPDVEENVTFILSSLDGEYSYSVPDNGAVTVIGRENDMREYLENKMFVSRSHAELNIQNNALRIRAYTTATNGTHVNGIEIMTDEYVELHDGDVLGLGGNNQEEQLEAAYFRIRTS